jgi:hypothetical protein
MGVILRGGRAKHRKFSYEPRFYDPAKEKKLKERMRIKSKVRRRNPAAFLSILLLLVLAAIVYLNA